MTEKLDALKRELKRILRKEIDENTSLEGLDSLTITEICVEAETIFGVEVSFDELKQAKRYWDLENIVVGKAK